VSPWVHWALLLCRREVTIFYGGCQALVLQRHLRVRAPYCALCEYTHGPGLAGKALPGRESAPERPHAAIGGDSGTVHFGIRAYASDKVSLQY